MPDYGVSDYAKQCINYINKTGWGAPLKLLEKYPEMMQEIGGMRPEYQVLIPGPTKIEKVGLIPNLSSAYASGSGAFAEYKDSPVFKDAVALAGVGAPTTVYLSKVTQPAVKDLPQYQDWAISCTTQKFKDYKGSWHATIPYPISGFDTSEIDYSSAGDSVLVPTYYKKSGTFVSAKVTGGTFKGSEKTISVELDNELGSEYDDWIVVKSMQLFGRKTGSTTDRVEYTKPSSLANDRYLQPGCVLRHTTIGGVKATQHVYKGALGLAVVDSYKYTPMTWGGDIYSSLAMPNVRRPITYYYGSNPRNSTEGYQWYGLGAYRQTPNTGYNALGIDSSINAPWISGYYNRIMWSCNVEPASDVLYTHGWTWNDYKKYGIPEVVGEPSKDFLREVYGAQQIAIYKTNTGTIHQDNQTGGLTRSFVAKAHNVIQVGTSLFVDDRCISTVVQDMDYALIFPDWEHVKAFFADWGILAVEDVNSAMSDPNDSVGGVDIPGDDEYGPWDPNYPGGNGWDNPGGDGVDYNPKDPGDKPLEGGTSIVTSATGSTCYVLRRPDVDQVTQWLMGEEFWKNASNLFTDKMSAINSLTLFPFDLETHDSLHLDAQTGISIAGVLAPNITAKIITAGYNTWVHGGSIEFGKNWSALRDDYNAFSTSSYTVFVPFVGMVEVPASAVIFRKLTLDYALDMVSGQGTAVLRSYGLAKYDQIDNGYIVALRSCQVGVPVPLVSSNTTQRSLAVFMGTLNGAVNGAGGNFNSSLGQSFRNQAGDGMANINSAKGLMNDKNVAFGAKDYNAVVKANAGSVAGGVAGAAGLAAVGAVLGGVKGNLEAQVANPMEFSHTGSIGSMSAWALGFVPYLTVTSQIPAVPSNYEWLMGRSSAQRGTLGDFAYNNLNYVECYTAKLNIPNAKIGELNAIADALRKGVFI